MILEDIHIEYLLYVEAKKIIFKEGKYLFDDGLVGYPYFDQLISIRVEKLGLTHIIYDRDRKQNVVALTSKGESLLQDESEAWE